MFCTPALFMLNTWLAARVGRDGSAPPPDTIEEQGTVIIAGMGRFGQVVNRLLKSIGHQTVVLDSHPETVDRFRRFGIKGYYGAVDRPDLLESAGLAHAKAVVIAIDDRDKSIAMANYIRRHHPEVAIIARALDRHHVYALHAAGADESVRETFDSAVRAGRYALRALGHAPEEAEHLAAEFALHDRRLLAELAKLWDPEVPLDQNAAYIEKAREQNAIIEKSLRGLSANVGKGEE
jgi:CPA2 family monovalent cation:H+ antiporter-2